MRNIEDDPLICFLSFIRFVSSGKILDILKHGAFQKLTNKLTNQRVIDLNTSLCFHNSLPSVATSKMYTRGSFMSPLGISVQRTNRLPGVVHGPLLARYIQLQCFRQTLHYGSGQLSPGRCGPLSRAAMFSSTLTLRKPVQASCVSAISSCDLFVKRYGSGPVWLPRRSKLYKVTSPLALSRLRCTQFGAVSCVRLTILKMTTKIDFIC